MANCSDVYMIRIMKYFTPKTNALHDTTWTQKVIRYAIILQKEKLKEIYADVSCKTNSKFMSACAINIMKSKIQIQQKSITLKYVEKCLSYFNLNHCFAIYSTLYLYATNKKHHSKLQKMHQEKSKKQKQRNAEEKQQ